MATETQSSAASQTTAFTKPVGHRLSWGSTIAGVSLFITLSWLLLMLGTAIGVGVADASDLSAIGNGLGIGSTIWILLSTLVATFAGGMLAAKLSGTIDDRIGALHGLTVWSVGTLLVIWLGMSGIGGTFSAIGGAFGSADKVSTTIVNTASGSSEGIILPDSVATSIAAAMKRQASEILSNNGADKGNVRSAMDSLSAQDTGAIASALISGDTEKAREELTSRTELSDSDIDSIIDNAEEQANNWENSDQVRQAERWLNAQINDIQSSVSQAVSDLAGTQVSANQISQALEGLEPETMMQAGQYLIMGEPEMAKDVLAVNTNLSDADIEAIVAGAEKETKQLIAKAKAELNEATETAASYTQAVLWSIFVASALGLIAGVIGGHFGAGAVRRIYAVRE